MIAVPLEIYLINNPLEGPFYDHEGLKIKTFFNGGSFVKIPISDCDSSILFHDDNSEVVDEFFVNLDKRLLKRAKDLRVVVYGRDFSMTKDAVKIDSPNAKESIDHIFNYLKNLVEITEERFANGFYMNKKIDLFIVEIEKDSPLWTTEGYSKKINFILKNLRRVSAKVIFFSKSVSYVPKKFVSMMEWKGFVGEENSIFAEEYFSDLKVIDREERYDHIGYYYSPDRPVLQNLYKASKELSELGEMDKKERVEDKARYLEFLKSLSDGSE